MATLLADNAYGTLAAGLAAGDTTLTFTSGHGARFPAVTGSDVLYACILNTSNALEEVKITAHTANADTCTIVRAQGATTAKVWVAGDRIEARLSSTSILSLNVASATTATSAGYAGSAATCGTAASVPYINAANDEASNSPYSLVWIADGGATATGGYAAGRTVSKLFFNPSIGALTVVGTVSAAMSGFLNGPASTATSQSGGFLRPSVTIANTNGFVISTGLSTIFVTPGVTPISLPTGDPQGHILHIVYQGGALSNDTPIVRTPSGTGYITSTVISTSGGALLIKGTSSFWDKLVT